MANMNGFSKQNGQNGSGEKDEVEVAYRNNLSAHREGISTNEVIKAYDAWADYDKDLCPGVYNGPVIAAQAVADYFHEISDRASLRVLDVAAGTGRVGLELHQRGFRALDALEPSRAMRDQCTTRNIYNNLYPDLIGKIPTSLTKGSYDAVVVAGGMGEGHIPVVGIDEMARLLKTGGILCIVMREEYLQSVAEYKERLEPHLLSLVDKGIFTKVSRTVVPNYSFNKNGVVYIYKVI